MMTFEAKIKIIGINPFVFVPARILTTLFKTHGKDKGPIPIKGKINGAAYRQTLVKYRGDWRLYINTTMLKNSPERIGEQVKISIDYDPADRTIAPHPKLIEALNNNPKAKKKFESLTPSLQKEIIRYISHLKTEASIDRNVTKAINFLLGKERFIGREL
ncbi:MAG: YdeI/OmpD-associated family protein [Cyclobacteriaceae bacterium]